MNWLGNKLTKLLGLVRLEHCVQEYLREKTINKSAGTRKVQLEISLQQSIERARVRRFRRGVTTPYKNKPDALSGTQYFDRLALDFFLASLPRGITPSEINLGHLLRHRRLLLEPEDLRRKALKPQSITRREGTIRNFLNFLVSMNYVKVSPAAELPSLSPANERQRRALQPKEVRKLLFNAEVWHSRALLFGAETGARRAQICFFTFGSIVWAKSEVRFESRRGFNPKNRRTTVVPITPRMLNLLRLIHREATARGKGGPDDFVFTDAKGMFITPDRLTKATARLFREVLGPDADIGAAIHAFRRTAASIWHELGGSLVEIQTLLGHSSPKTTEGYIQTSTARLRKVVSKRRGY